MKDKRVVCASVGKYLMILLGMPSAHGDFPVPRYWMVSSNVSLVIISKSVTEGSPRGGKSELVGEVSLSESGTDSYTEVVPAPQGGRVW
jgi:hypothetical protein